MIFHLSKFLDFRLFQLWYPCRQNRIFVFYRDASEVCPTHSSRSRPRDEETYIFGSSGVSGLGNAGVLDDVLICRLVRLLEALPICARISSRELASMVSAFANLPSSSSCMAWMLFCTACK